MKGRTVTQRNLLGAFVGGVLGILAFGYFSVFLLPFGVFAGVIGGWWYEEIWQHIVDGIKSGLKTTLLVRDELVRRWNTLVTFLFTPHRRQKEMRFDPGPALAAVGFLLFPLIWLTRRVGWAKEHPVNKAYLVRWAVTLANYMLSGFVLFWAARWIIDAGNSAEHLHRTNGQIFWIGLAPVGLMALLTLVSPLFWDENGDDTSLDKMRRFYSTWSRYASKGPLGFFASELLWLVTVEYTSMAWMLGGLAWFIGAGGIFVAIVTILSAGIGLVKGVYHVVTRAGHWLCFGVTLATTIVAAWLGYRYFSDARILWATALATGILSAVGTEALRRALVWGFQTYRPARAVALVPIGKQLRPETKLFLQISASVGEWFYGLLPMRPLQA